MKPKDKYNVLAVYSLTCSAGREHFSGVLDEMANTRNWHLTTVPPERLLSYKELINEKGKPIDGIILSEAGTDDVMDQIAQSHIPTVLVDIAYRKLSARCDAIATVWSDNADAGRRAAQHFIERGGYKSAGYVHELQNKFYSRERMMAFRQIMKRNGCETHEFPKAALSSGDYDVSPDDFFNGLRAWVRDLPKPAAVMAVSDMRAADVINACRAEGIPVPSQVAVIGVDHDVAQHAKCGMSISSVVLNSRMMGRQAVRELDFLFRHPKWKGRPHEVLIPAKDVFAGESTSRSVSATRLVNIALDFIAENCTRDLAPEDVVAHLGCSRRLVELRFSQVRSTTIRKAISDARLNEVRRRIHGGESVNGIVKALHFKSANQLYQMYKRHFGHIIRQTSF